jgi:hypothetical protein
MYRFERDGWTIDDVAAEMRRQTYRYGWLPGYIYAMAKNKPPSGSASSDLIYDRNRAVERAPDSVVASTNRTIEPNDGRLVSANRREPNRAPKAQSAASAGMNPISLETE